MNKKMYYIPETIGAIFWLVMDYCWLSKYYGIAILCAMMAIAFLGIAATNTFLDNDCKISERLNFSASWIWCAMNSFWLMSDLPIQDSTTSEFSLNLAKLFFIIASALVLSSIIFSIIEKNRISFSRLKINTKDSENQKQKKETPDSKFVESLNKSNLKIQ